MPDATLDSIKRTRSPSRARSRRRWAKGFRSVNVALRKTFDLYANVRPPRPSCPGLRFDNVDIVLVRENTEGLYIGIEHYVKHRRRSARRGRVDRGGHAHRSERIVRYAFEYALKHGRKKVTLVHKANILKYSQGLFLDTGRDGREGVRRARRSSRTRSSTRWRCTS
jgi:isocitrate dehydrogenase (NAD+)